MLCLYQLNYWLELRESEMHRCAFLLRDCPPTPPKNKYRHLLFPLGLHSTVFASVYTRQPLFPGFVWAGPGFASIYSTVSVVTLSPSPEIGGSFGPLGCWESEMETWQSTHTTAEKSLCTQTKDKRESFILVPWARITFVNTLADTLPRFIHVEGEWSDSKASQVDNKDRHSHSAHCWTL